MKIMIAYHGHCFDGMTSAAVLTRFFQKHYGPAEFSYKGLDHQAGGSFVPAEILTGDVNAVVDFRYSMSPALTWFFDHHITGIVGAEERVHFEADQSGKKFFDPTYGSCCKFAADILRDNYGFELGDLTELVEWGHIIDSARFPDAQTAVELAAPALQLMSVLEVHGDDAFLMPRIKTLAEGTPLADIVSDATVQTYLAPIRKQNEAAIQLIGERAQLHDGVVTFEMLGGVSERFNKFIPYHLFPDAIYTVALTAGASRVKVSVGTNPWRASERRHNIATICAQYGGGGHPVVGAVSFKPTEVERGRQVAEEIANILRN